MDPIRAYLGAERRIVALYDRCIECRQGISNFRPHPHPKLASIFLEEKIEPSRVAEAFNSLAGREVYVMEGDKLCIKARFEDWERMMPEAVRAAMGLQLVEIKTEDGAKT